MKHIFKLIFADAPAAKASSPCAKGLHLTDGKRGAIRSVKFHPVGRQWLTIVLFWITTCIPALAQKNTFFTINASRVSNGDWFENSGIITTDSDLVKIRDEHFCFRIRVDTTSYDSFVDDDGYRVDMWEGKVSVKQDTVKCILAVYMQPQSALFIMHLTEDKSFSFHTERVDF